MPQPFFSKQKPGPVRHGNGGGADLATQAQQYTADALELLKTQLKSEELDPKQRFAVAKYLLELGWGRPRAMRATAADTPGTEPTTITGEIETRLLSFMKELTLGHHPAHERGGDAAVHRLSGPDRMEQHGPPDAADPAG